MKEDKNQRAASRESEERSGMSLRYESYDPHLEIRIASKGTNSDSDNRFGRDHLFIEGTSNGQQVSISNKSPVNGLNQEILIGENNAPFVFCDEKNKTGDVKNLTKLGYIEKPSLHSIDIGNFLLISADFQNCFNRNL